MTLLVGLEPTPARLEVWRATIAPQELNFVSKLNSLGEKSIITGLLYFIFITKIKLLLTSPHLFKSVPETALHYMQFTKDGLSSGMNQIAAPCARGFQIPGGAKSNG